MSGKITGYDADLIMKTLTAYSDGVGETIKAEAKKLAKQAKEELKSSSPKSKKDRTHYADSWKVKTTEYTGKIEVTVYNEKKPGLTHLLEYGYINSQTGKRVPAKKHIEPVQEQLNSDLEQACKEIIENGGKLKK
jgi:hypothetical protein